MWLSQDRLGHVLGTDAVYVQGQSILDLRGTRVKKKCGPSLTCYIQLGDPRQIKVIQAGGISPNDLRVFVLGHSGQDLRQNLAGLWECGLTIGVIRAPPHVVHDNKVPQADADRILLEAQEDIAMEKVTGTPAILESIDSFLMAFAVSVVHARE